MANNNGPNSNNVAVIIIMNSQYVNSNMCMW
jgi:hypothetical protein